MAYLADDREERARALRRLRAYFKAFGATQANGKSPVYAAMSEAVAADAAILRVMLATRATQRKPSLLFACVNALLADHPDDPLAAYYPIHGGTRPADDQLAGAFAGFCRRYRDQLVALLRSRSTQTNEPRRAIALHLAVSHLARHWNTPVAVAEVGASAGLNLSFDRYRYCFTRDHYGIAPQEIGGPDAGGEVIGTQFLCRDDPAGWFTPVPVVTARLGIDARPVDLSDPEQRRWLEAFIWPERLADLELLRSAMDTTLAGEIPVVTGDAAGDLTGVLAGVGAGEPLVVFTASLLSYLTPAERRSFLRQLDLAAGQRPVAWVFAEAAGLVARAGVQDSALDGPLGQRSTRYLIGTSIRGPQRRDDLLALADPYIRWLAPRRHPVDDFWWAP